MKQSKTSKAPLMYKGWLIRTKQTPFQGKKLCAHNLFTGQFINPLYNTWDDLKAVIDAIKVNHI
jgi:hypothetical protein